MSSQLKTSFFKLTSRFSNAGGVMAQTLYAHMNKRKKKKKDLAMHFSHCDIEPGICFRVLLVEYFTY
jgi:hypothetical protein